MDVYKRLDKIRQSLTDNYLELHELDDLATGMTRLLILLSKFKSCLAKHGICWLTLSKDTSRGLLPRHTQPLYWSER